MNRRIIKITSLKFDRTPHRTWKAELIEATGSMLICRGHFEMDVIHPDLGNIARGTESIEYYWTDRWHSIFQFHDPDGSFRYFYCNVNMPPVVQGDSLEFVDLDLDLLVRPDCRPEILDEDEFETNAMSYGYGDKIREKALRELNVLTGMVERAEFPFDSVIAHATVK